MRARARGERDERTEVGGGATPCPKKMAIFVAPRAATRRRDGREATRVYH